MNAHSWVGVNSYLPYWLETHARPPPHPCFILHVQNDVPTVPNTHLLDKLVQKLMKVIYPTDVCVAREPLGTNTHTGFSWSVPL